MKSYLFKLAGKWVPCVVLNTNETHSLVQYELHGITMQRIVPNSLVRMCNIQAAW